MPQFIRYLALIAVIIALELTSLFTPISSIVGYGASLIAKKQSDQLGESQWIKPQVDYARLKSLEEENQHLRSLLAFTERTHTSSVVAYRIARSSDVVQNAIIINKGSRDGIHSGDAAVIDDGILVGVVQSVSDTTSIVLPLNDPRSKILASIVQEKKVIRGIVEGKFNIGLSLTLIPISDEVRKSDLVVTSGQQDRIPSGLVIGTIHDSVKKPEDLFQSASLTSPASLHDLQFVSVIVQNQ